MKSEINIEEPPEHTQRRVVWNCDNAGNGQLVILVGYCPDTLAYFAGLFQDAKRSCPDIREEDAVCSKVRKSNCHYGFTLMLIPIKGPERHIEGFEKAEWNHLEIDSY